MRDHDEEREQIRTAVSCTAVLEGLQPGWVLDRHESTRCCRKYRAGPGHILIVNHEGRGWWDPLSEAKGDVFDLVRHLDPGLGFGQACAVLRAFVGLEPFEPPAARRHHVPSLVRSPAERWARRRTLTPGSPAWRYLAGARGLPASVLAHAACRDLVREGPRASAWFAHRDDAGCLTGAEMRGPAWRGFSADGTKALFRLTPDASNAGTRLAVTEAAIDALSLAALEGMRSDTLYTATAGGIGPATVTCLEQELRTIADRSGAVLVAATDADVAGERMAARLAELAAAAGVACERLRPWSGHNDWNDLLRAQTAETC